MSGSAPPSNPTTHHVQALLPKLNNVDPDIRYMSLNDLHAMLLAGHSTFLSQDYATCARVIEGFIKTLNDQNGDVQNMAIKCLGPFVNRAPESIICPMIEKISNLQIDNAVDRSIPALAVRSIVVALPRPLPGAVRSTKVTEAYSAISKAVIPRLVGYIVVPIGGPGSRPGPPEGMVEAEIETGDDTNALDVLAEVARCFGPMLQESEVEALKKISIQVLDSPHCGSVMKKKAVAAVSALSPFFTDSISSCLVSETIEKLRQPNADFAQVKLYLSIFGAIAKAIPRKFGPYLKALAPFVLGPLSQQQLDQQRKLEADSDEPSDPQIEEVREAALAALDSFALYCAPDVISYSNDIVESALRFLRYDPNFADDADEDMDDDDADGLDDDEDFEEETGFDDEDDVSWKVRRSAAKLLHTLAKSSTLVSEEALYGKIAPALITRFSEREDSVRVEVISTLASLVGRAREQHHQFTLDAEAFSQRTAPSRKRRRGSSSAAGIDAHVRLAALNGYTSPSTPPPQDGPQQRLAAISPEIIRAAAKLLKSGTSSTKQACSSLLSVLLVTQRGGLSSAMALIIDPVVDVLRSSANSNSSATASTQALQIESLNLLRAIVDLHSTKILKDYFSDIVLATTTTVKGRQVRVAVEAVETLDVLIKALTPPRSAAALPNVKDYLDQIYSVLTSKISASETETEVRQAAVRALGLLLGRTSGPKGTELIGAGERRSGQTIILERMRNELTRPAAIRATETIAVLTQSQRDLEASWVQQISIELAAQLRKASRTLRGSSLSALKLLAINDSIRQHYDDTTINQLVEALLPLLSDADLHMLGPALTTMGAYATERPKPVLTPALISAVCTITKLELQGSSLDALLGLVEQFGTPGYGLGLMQALLRDVGVTGNPEIVGQVIGALLVSNEKRKSVLTVDVFSFQKELRSTKDEKRKCLALYILGEGGLRLGSASPLSPEDFSEYFDAESEKVRIAAAVSLGRAGAGNVKKYLPTIISSMQTGHKYLLLHSVKELLQHGNAEADTLEYSKPMWDIIMSAATDSDNRVLGAECVGRLTIIDPASYLPKLQEHLNSPEPLVRGMIISAFRYTFADTDASYDVYLQPIIAQLLSKMLDEDDLDNRRIALTTFNSAAANKINLIRPYLPQLLPLTMKETIIRPDLIREVSMGPFKHKVDDGLELRKSAYETLYALVDTAFNSLPTADFYDRVIAGIGDEHEIKIICSLMLTKLITLAPVETAHSLDRLAEAFRVVLAFRPKDNAVKQELEKLQEHNKAILKVMIQMNKAFPAQAAESRPWAETLEWARKEHPVAYKAAEEEVREKDR